MPRGCAPPPAAAKVDRYPILLGCCWLLLLLDYRRGIPPPAGNLANQKLQQRGTCGDRGNKHVDVVPETGDSFERKSDDLIYQENMVPEKNDVVPEYGARKC